MPNKSANKSLKIKKCTQCDIEVKKQGDPQESVLQCVICHKFTHVRSTCVEGKLGDENLIDILREVGTTATQAYVTRTYLSSFYHICRNCIQLVGQYTCLVHAIIETSSMTQEKIATTTATLRREIEEQYKIIRTLEESVKVAKEYSNKVGAEMELLRQSQPSQIKIITQSLEQIKKEHAALLTQRDYEFTSLSSQIVDFKGTITGLNAQITKLTEEKQVTTGIMEKLNAEIATLRKSSNQTKKRKLSNDDRDVSYTDLDEINQRIAASQSHQAEIVSTLKEMKKQLDELSKKSIIPTPPEQKQGQGGISVTPIGMTYARILKNSEENSKRIRHIDGKGTDLTSRGANLNKFRETEEVKALERVIIGFKGTTSMMITFESSEEAVKLDNIITAKYSDLVESKGVATRRPQVKIVRIPAQDLDKEGVLKEICESNDWLPTEGIELTQVFTIEIAIQKYVNCILQCEVETQEEILRRGFLLFSGTQCRVYEQIDILQCGKCARYGHTALNCINNIACKKCASNHTHKECTSVAFKCVNCELANLSFGKTYDSAHNSAFDPCPVRVERVEAIKRLIVAKN